MRDIDMAEVPRYERESDWYIEYQYVPGADGGYEFVQDLQQELPTAFIDGEQQ